MVRGELALRITGKESEGGGIDFDAFVDELRRFQDVLTATDRFVSRDGELATDFMLEGLSYSSPAVVTVRPVIREDAPDQREAVKQTLWSGMELIQFRAQRPEGFDSTLLQAYQKLVEPVGPKFDDIALLRNGDELSLTSTLKANVEKILGPRRYSNVSVRGMLDALNIHPSKREFTLFPLIGPKRIRCTMPEEHLEEGIRGIGRYVRIAGIAAYNRVDRYPERISVEDIEVYEDAEDVPKLSDFAGCAPNATGELSSEEFVRKLRDEWQ